MTNQIEQNNKYIIRQIWRITYGEICGSRRVPDNTYVSGISSGSIAFCSDISDAEVFQENEVPEHYKNSKDYEVINLNSKRGLEFLVKEIEKIDRWISDRKLDIEIMEKRKKKIQGFPWG